MALNSLYCADVPLSNYSLTHINNNNTGKVQTSARAAHPQTL